MSSLKTPRKPDRTIKYLSSCATNVYCQIDQKDRGRKWTLSITKCFCLTNPLRNYRTQ